MVIQKIHDKLSRKAIKRRATYEGNIVSIRSQLKIQEMAFMLVAVVFFFILVGLFAFSIFYVDLYKEANKISEDRTLSALTNLADTPELSCSTSKSNCIDADKLISLVRNQDYARFWPFSSLQVVKQSAFKKTESEMELIDVLSEKAKNVGSEVEIISVDTREGAQFKELGGVGAILRYKLD